MRTPKSRAVTNGASVVNTREEIHSNNNDASVRRLDAIIRLLIEKQLANKTLQKKDYVLILDSVGLSSREIGTIVGQPSKDIASWIKRLKAGKS